uniref:Uncharacterized protein n=1 Tax=Timema cristinae TaxID=61476 RepID=A0A7R9D4F3_TIMCR|nr:unnamed protein product [Timema cristinae]
MEHSASNAVLREPTRDGNSLLRMCSQPWASAELVSHYALLVSCSPGLVKVRPEVLSRCSPQAQSTGECSGNSELVHTPVSPITGSTDSSKQHEVFNPGYSRTSSTNSIPQKTFEAQPQCAPVSGLRSK